MIEPSTVIQLGGVAIALATGLIAGARSLGKMELNLSAAISRARQEMDDKIELQYREFGESLQALRTLVTTENVALQTKVFQVELFGRDTYVRRESVKELSERMEAHLRKIEEKLEAIAQGARSGRDERD